jgi:DNA-binding transcriptional LysR family regulator
MTFHITHVPPTREVFRVLRERSVDLVIGRINAPVVDDDVECEVLFKEPLLAAAGRQNRWAGRRKIALADLIDEPWTMAMPDTAGGALVVDAFRASGLAMPKQTVVCNSLHMQYALLGTGRYLGFVPGSLLRFAPERVSLQVLPIQLPIKAPPVGIIRLKNRITRPAVQLFVENVRQVANPTATRPTSK